MELACFEKDLNLAESLFSSNLIHVLSLCCLKKYWIKFWNNYDVVCKHKI